MMNQKSDFEPNMLLFNEEVRDGELIDKKNYSDLVYVETNNNVKQKILIWVAIILIFISFICCLFGFIFTRNKIENNNFIVNNYDLFVTHANMHYGGKNISIGNYNSYDNSYSYSFTIDNRNLVNLDYSIEFLNYSSDIIQSNVINYSLIKNDMMVSTGIIEAQDKYIIFSDNIAQNSKDVYVIKLWTNDVKKDLKYNFKINVFV